VNQVQQSMRDGQAVFTKRRRVGGSAVVWLGNQFLAWAHSASRMLVHADDWMDWEVHCTKLLYPERPRPNAVPGQYIVIPSVCGTSLRQMLHRNEADLQAFVAAARELRRLHRLPCSYSKAAWSHGDLHLDNIVYDASAGRAALIDFDTRHDPRASETQRHSDDLKVFLLELLGWPDERWCPLATAFVEEYRAVPVLNELIRQLFVPRGFARILFYTRTSRSLSTHQIEQRLERLREIIHRIATTASTCARSKPGVDE
jgi:hypothetical protein